MLKEEINRSNVTRLYWIWIHNVPGLAHFLKKGDTVDKEVYPSGLLHYLT